MGYNTYFSGEFNVVPPLEEKHRVYLQAFASTRRMIRDEELAKELPDEKRRAVGLPIGTDGAYFVGSEDNFGQNDDGSVFDHNSAPGGASYGFAVNRRKLTAEERELFPYGSPYNVHFGDRCEEEDSRHGLHDACEYACVRLPKQDRQPGLWCQWVPSEDGTVIEWDEGEKFYAYTEWLAYLIVHFLGPWGYALDGSVDWDGEESYDLGRIKCEPASTGGTIFTVEELDPDAYRTTVKDKL